MKIISIVPGFGGTFYCGNCLRDSTFTASLLEAGHDAMVLPMYLPLSVNGKTVTSDIPVFYGAVNIYIKQQFPFLRHMPQWMENLLNSKSLLRLAASQAGSTRAEGLEELTESMLLGEGGRQSRELEEVIQFLIRQKPDVVHFSNALLLGMAHRVKNETGAKVVCSLQDEDVWVDVMRPEYRGKMWSLLAEKAKDVDIFIAVSRFFAGVMKQKMSIPEEKIQVIHIGIDPSKYDFHEPPVVPAVGYVSRICRENGFHILVDAFIRIKKDPAFGYLKLLVTGGMTGDDKPFLKEQIRKLRQADLAKDLEIFPEFDFESLRNYLAKVSLISVPVLHGEAFGLYQLEAMASGVPVVQPALGAFPEVIGLAGGGRVYEPNSPEALAEAMKSLLQNPGELSELGRCGRQGIIDHFSSKLIISRMMEIYQ
ncbi:MAG: glycosyltransferase family 4 protein [Syntrophothermus sp.]